VVEGTYLDNFHYWHVLIQATLLYVKILKTEEGLKLGFFGCEKLKFELLAGKLKFEVPATFVAFTNFREFWDVEATSKFL